MNQRLVKLPAAASLALLFTADAGAADYAAGFVINADALHNDNIRLVRDDKTPVTKFGISPRLTLGVHTETTKVDLNSSLDFNRYDKSEFNSDDQSVALVLSRQFETQSLGLNANYINNSTLSSELLTSGRIGTERAEQYSLSPNWSYAITESNIIQLSGSYTVQNYKSDAYIGYKNIGSELDWIHIVNDRTKVIAVATYSKYQADDVVLEVPGNPVFFYLPGAFGTQSYAVQTKGTGALLGLDYQWSEQSLIKVRLGGSQSRTSYQVKDPNQICTNDTYLVLVAFYGQRNIGGVCNPDTSGSQSNAELEWIWNNERHQFNLSASKTIQPTSNGYAVDSIHMESTWSYRLSELNKITAGLSLARNRAIDKDNPLQNTDQADRNYGSASLQYQRQLSEHWFLSTRFQFSEQEYTQLDDQASSRAYSLDISYSPQQWHWAR